jgi:hypothetical protein
MANGGKHYDLLRDAQRWIEQGHTVEINVGGRWQAILSIAISDETFDASFSDGWDATLLNEALLGVRAK